VIVAGQTQDSQASPGCICYIYYITPILIIVKDFCKKLFPEKSFLKTSFPEKVFIKGLPEKALRKKCSTKGLPEKAFCKRPSGKNGPQKSAAGISRQRPDSPVRRKSTVFADYFFGIIFQYLSESYFNAVFFKVNCAVNYAGPNYSQRRFFRFFQAFANSMTRCRRISTQVSISSATACS
jgi:hypothetical protein